MPAAASDPAKWSLRLCGAAALIAPDGGELALDRLAALIAARLALAGPQPRDWLARELWPDVEVTRARGNLRQRLLRLRAQAGWAWLEGADRLALHPGLQVAALDAAPLLEGLSAPAGGELAEWLDAQRAEQRRRESESLQAAMQQAEAGQRLDEALALAARWVALEPSAEAPRRGLARLHYLNHDRAQALQVLDELARLVRREHGVALSPATLALRGLVERAAPLNTAAPAWSPALARPPRLIGRAAELAQLRGTLDESGALLLLGEAGLGKSRLMAEALAGRPAVLAVKAQAGDAGVPFATLARLLRRLWPTQPPARPESPQAQAALLRLLPELCEPALEPPQPPGSERLLQASLEDLLLQSGVATVAVDDLHFADEASLNLLQSLIGAERLSGLAWLLAQRPGEGGPATAALHEALIEAQRLRPLALLPLDVAQVGELISCLQLGLDAAALAPRLHRHTGGNPLFVLETLRQMQVAGLPDGRLPPSATVGALIDRRLRTLSAPALALARLAAVAGPDFTPALAEQATGRPALDLADAWVELEAAQVLRDSAFAHDLVLEAVQRSLPAAIRRHLHGAVAGHLQKAGAAPARLAAHWLEAGDEGAALPCLLAAAGQARDTLRRREEADFLERAAEIASRAAAPQQTEAHALFVRSYLTRECVDGVQAALPLLDRALSVARNTADQARVLALRASGRTKLFELDGAVADGQAALALAEQAGDDKITADIMSSLASALSMLGRNEEATALMERHWPLVEAMTEPKTSLFGERGLVLDNAGRPHEARPFHLRAVQLARERGEHSEVVIGSHNLAVGYIDTGELAAAAQVLQDAEAMRLAHDGLDGTNVVGWDLQASVWRDLGRYGPALQASERTLEADLLQTSVRAPLDRLHRAWLWYWLGQWARAGQDLAGEDGYPELPAWVPARALQLRARLRAAQGLPAGDAWTRVAALQMPGALRTMGESIALDLAAADADPARGLRTAQALRTRAQADRLYGLRWRAEWQCAALAWAAGQADAARAHASACRRRPPEHTPLDLAEGHWWHGLWRVWQALGEADHAEAARTEGVAWIHRTLQRDLPAHFQASFREAVAAHRALLTG